MPTSNYMVSATVWIAWDGGFRVPMASWTWTDVSDYVELAAGIDGTWGRGDERSTADANTLTLTFDNRDGRFTAARAASPYYPNVVLYKPIMLKLDPVDGAEQTYFVGYITSWPVEWEDTDAYAYATVTASSRLARLGLNAAWRSLVEETYLFDSPVAYYPLGEPEGATSAADVSGNGAAPLAMVGAGTDVVFGQATGPGTDDLTAATFAGGKYLSGPVVMSPAGGVTLECFVLRSGAPAATETFARLTSNDGTAQIGLAFTTSGAIIVSTITGASVTSASSYTDGGTHHVAVTADGGGTLTLLVDGVSVGTDSTALTFAIDRFDVGGGGGSVLTGVVAHAAVYAAAVSSHAAAGLTAYAGELTDDRLERYANLADIPDAELTLDVGSTTMLHVDTTGANVVEMMRLVETTEGGVLFDGRDGKLTFHNRSRRYTAASVLTLDFAKHEVEADYSPRLDPSALTNDVSVANATGTVSAHVKDDASIAANGLATASATTASDDEDEPLNFASWALLQFKTPKPRVPSLSVQALEQVGKTVNCAAVMAVTVGDKVTVTNHPAQAAATTTSYFVEGGSFSLGPEQFGITWNISPSSPDDLVLIIDDATRGVIDTNVIGF